MIQKPGEPIYRLWDKTKIFLAGTIDNGASVNWQDRFAKILVESIPDIVVYNPRNDKWDTDMLPTLDNPEFRAQVEWELDGLHTADYIIMNFLPTSKSPITLLELGLFANDGKILMLCPEEFYRSGNVNFICETYGIEKFNNLKEIIKYIQSEI